MVSVPTPLSTPIIYALKIPEFRQSLITVCSRCRAVDGMDREGKEGRDTATIELNTVVESRTSSTDTKDTQQNFEHESMDTKL